MIHFVNDTVMRKIFLFVFLLYASLCRSQLMTIQGTVCDFFTSQMLDSVRLEVLRPDSSVAYVFTSEKYGMWNFHSRKVSSGNYILKFSKKDYDPLFINRTFHYVRYRKEFEELGKVYMHKRYSRTVNLDEVVVCPTLLKMVHHGDTIVYNADAFNLPDGSMLDELVRILPGASIDGKGQIFVNGKKINSLLLNGNDFFNGNPKMALDNLVAYTVRDIKVYERQTDREVALGISEAGRELPLVMDVNLKKQYNIGWMGSMEGGYGTDDRYLGRLFLMRFSKQSRITLYGDANNVGDDYTYVNSGRWNESRLSSGLHNSIKGGVDIVVNDKHKRYSVKGNVEVNRMKSTYEEYTSSTEFYPSGDIYQKKSSNRKDKNTSLTSRLDISLTPRARTYLKVIPYVNYRKFNNCSAILSADLNGLLEEKYRGEVLDSVFSPIEMSGVYRELVNSTLRNNGQGMGHDVSTGSSIEYSYRPKYNNDRLTVKGNFLFGNALNRVVNDYDNQTNDQNLHRYKYNEGNANRYNYMLEADYVYSLVGFPKKSFSWVGLGYKFHQNYQGSHRPFYDLEETEFDGINLIELSSVTNKMSRYMNITNSYHSARLNREHAVELSLGSSFHGLELDLGLPVLFVNNRLDYQRDNIDTIAVRNKVFLNPYLNIRGKVGQNGKFKGFEFKYKLLFRQPDLVQTLNFMDSATPLVVRLGNVSLKTASIHRFNARFYQQNGERYSSSSLTMSCNLMNNLLCQSLRYDATTGIRTYQPQTINGNWNMGFIFDYHAPTKNYNRRLVSVTTANYSHNVDFSGLDNNGSSYRNTVRNTTVRENVDYTYFPTNLGKAFVAASYTVSTSLQYTHSESAIRQTMNLFDFRIGLRVRQPLPWGIEVEGKLETYIHCGYQDHNFNTQDFVLSAYLKKTLLKNRMYVKLQVFDLLNQTHRIQYTLNAQMQTETYRNALRRFAMLSLNYNITKQPKKR